MVLTEGPFDLAKVSLVYPAVMASMTASLSAGKLKRLRDATCLVTFYDYGHGGDLARQRLSEWAWREHVPISHVTPSEADGDPGAMHPVSIYDLLIKLSVFTKDCLTKPHCA